MMNPYVQDRQNKYVYPGQKFEVMYGVRAHNQLYYQIANQTFISAEFVNMDLKPEEIAPYQNKQILAKPEKMSESIVTQITKLEPKNLCPSILFIKFRILMAALKVCGFIPL
ncbi:hypothetical protein SDC49_05975 [Lactobacillus sp. R2/2]|nr:hypothetical protein [Lactobacillus sp. R2/2]